MSHRQASYRFVWLAATTVLPTLAVAGLGWVVVRQDLGLERATQREQAADVGVAALTRILGQFDELLLAADAPAAPSLGRMADGATFTSLTRDGLTSRAGLGLPFYPVVTSTSPRPGVDPFATADRFEFATRDLSAALEALTPLAHSSVPEVRAQAWVRIARIDRKRGHLEEALNAFGAVGSDQVAVDGWPAGLAGRLGRALIFDQAARSADLRREATTIAADLANGRWVLTQGQYENGLAEVTRWLGGTPPEVDADRIAIAGAIDSAWREWVSGASSPSGRERNARWTAQESILTVLRSDGVHLAVLAVTPALVRREAFGPVASDTIREAIELRLVDGDGHSAWGTPPASDVATAVRPASVTELPWTLMATNRSAGWTTMTGRSRLLMAGVGLMMIVVAGSGYAMHRAVARELRVARLQSDFVAAVSHEFRTPLTTIRQLSELLARARVSSDARRQQFADTILAESERLQRLVESLLDFGRVESGRLTYHFEPVDLPVLVREVAAVVERDSGAVGYRIEVTTTPAVLWVRGDRESLTHVFRNLLENAIKYSPERRDIEVSLRNGHGRVSVCVRDHGLGIKPDEREVIFDKFVRGSAARAVRAGGTGVGLAMARQIVAAHGGTIEVESAPGDGSRFVVSLPAGHPRGPADSV